MRNAVQWAVVAGFALLLLPSANADSFVDNGFTGSETVNNNLFQPVDSLAKGPTGCVNGDCRNGYGTYQFANGNRYIGDFIDGKSNGKGILYCANGNKYIGHWQDNWQQGEGKFSFIEGHEYLGQFQRSQFHGMGKMCYANGDVYNGDWVANTPEGLGTYAFHTGDRYEGQFQAGLFNGKGTMFYKSGARFVGSWLDNKKHGKGSFYNETGKVVDGEWVQGKIRGNPSPNSGADAQGVEVATVFTKNDSAAEADATSFDPSVKVWAVVAGVANYTDMPALTYTDDDAYQFYAFLKSPEGGALPDSQVEVLVNDNATRDNLLAAMRTLFLKADENDVVLFYFSGHGIEGAFVPVDFDGYNYRLEHTEIRQILEQSRARQKLVLGDACHSGSLIGGQFAPELMAAKAPSVGDMLAKYYEAFENCESGLALFMSSKGAEVSLEDTGLRSGVFSHFLIKGLKGDADADKDKIVSIQELFSFVKVKVSAYTAGAQTPVLTGKYDGKLPMGVVRY